MRKFKMFFILLLWIQICFAEDKYPLEIPDEIPDNYEFQFFDKVTAPDKDWVDFGSGGCTGSCSEENETQGITSIGGNYWILSKNKWFYVYKLEEDSSLFSRKNKKDQISNNDFHYDDIKYGDIDFFDGHLYVPNGNKIDIYKWSQSDEKFEKDPVHWKIDRDSFGTAIHPYGRHLFYKMNAVRDRIHGKKILDSETNQTRDCYDDILLIDSDGYPMSHKTLTDHNWTQGMAFSPNGRFLFFVHDDAHDENSKYTGIYVYYFDDENYKKFLSNKCYGSAKSINAFLVGFKNIKYDPDAAWARLDELEGIDVREIQGYDVHQLVLHNTDINSDEKFSIYHYKTWDYDGDGVKDVYDNCPFSANRDQKDWNRNGIGDACEDYDEDGVFDSDDNCVENSNSNQDDWDGNGVGDMCDDYDGDKWVDYEDNCPGVWNPEQEDWNQDGIGDMCQDFDKDGWMDNEDACPDVANCIKCNENCRFSTSECCSRERSHCDMDGDGRWDLEPYLELNSKFDLEQFIDHYAYSASGIWEKSRDDVHITDTTSNTYGGTWRGTQETGHKIEIYSQASYFCGQESKPSKLSTYYCYCGKDKESHKRCDDGGACGKNFAEPNQVWDKQFGHTTWLPTPQGFENIEINSGDSCSQNGKFKKIQSKGNYETLDYKNDPVLGGKIFDTEGYEVPHPRTEEEKQALLKSEDYPLLKLSFGVVTGNSDDYVKEIGKDEYEVNKEYFSNYDQSPLHGDKNKLILAKKAGKLVDIIIDDIPYFKAVIIPGYGKWWYDMMWDYLGQKPWDDPRWELGYEDILKDTMYESIARPSEFTKVGFDGNSITAELVSFHDDYNQIFRFGGRNAVYFKDGNTFSIAFNDVNGIFNEVYSVPEGIPMRSAAVTTVGTEIFMAAGMDNMILHKRKKPDATEIVPIRTTNFVKITFCGNNLSMMRLAPLPERPVHISLFAIEEKIHAFMIDSRGKGKIIAYSNENDSWEELSAFDFGQEFSLNNMFIKGKDLYFTAPDLENKTTLYSWDSGSGVHKIASIDTDYDAFIKPFSSSKKIILADLKKLGSTVDAWELSNNGFTKITVPVNKPEYKMAFCINENADSVFPGATDFHEKCQSVGNYNYKSKLFFDYKYSLAGYENSIYLGGLTGIRRMEIGENGKLTKKEMLYSGKTKSLAVYKDVLYAANKDEIDLFSISEDGKISRISGLKATDCENLKTENGKLFTAENKQVRIFSLSDPKNPELLKTITVEGSVKDIEILNNKLFVYEETGGCFSRKGTVRIYDISDLSNITQAQNFEKTCKKAEFQKSGSKVYLGCKTETFKVEENGLTKLHGSPKYLRDGYVFDGILYQVFSGTLHKSSVTKNTQPDNDGWF